MVDEFLPIATALFVLATLLVVPALVIRRVTRRLSPRHRLLRAVLVALPPTLVLLLLGYAWINIVFNANSLCLNGRFPVDRNVNYVGMSLLCRSTATPAVACPGSSRSNRASRKQTQPQMSSFFLS